MKTPVILIFRKKNKSRSNICLDSNNQRNKFRPRPLVCVDQEQNKLSHNCPFQDLTLCVFGRVSCLVSPLRHMPGRTTRKCKETLLQVRERLTREQANRTRKRIKELLDTKDLSSDSDSEEEQDSSSDGSCETLSLLRRDLYLGLLCLLLLIVLLTYWVRITTLRN